MAKKKAAKKDRVLKLKFRDENPLRWPDGSQRTLLGQQEPRNSWKKSIKEYQKMILDRLDILGITEVVFSFNLSPSDRQDPGVAVYFAKARKEDFSWQAALGITVPNPTRKDIEDAFRAKAKIYHDDMPTRDAKLYAQMDEHRRRALLWVNGEYEKEGEYVLSVDRCTETRWNMRAVLELVKAAAVFEEYGNPGTLERTFRGFRTALPAKASSIEEK